MKLNSAVITALMKERGITQNQLARQIGVRPGTLSNALNARRGVGRAILAALLRQFPEETVATLTVKEVSK